jgi:ribosome-associated protein
VLLIIIFDFDYYFSGGLIYPLSTENKVFRIARIADERKAENIIILDLRKICDFTEYFVLATGQTTNHLRGICDEIREKFKADGITLVAFDGEGASSWLVLDYGDVVFHIFDEETRQCYDLEHLWGDAETVDWQ